MIACGGNGGGSGGGSGKDAGTSMGQNGGSGKSAGGSSMTSGGAGASSGDCTVSSSFHGQPGTLWVERGPDGELTAFDTKDGKLLKTAQPPGYSPRVAAGNGLLWLLNTDNNRDITPYDPEANKAFPALGFDPDDTPVFANGTLWTTGVDSNVNINAYAISSPTSVKSLTVNYDVIAFAAGPDGFYFVGGGNPASLTELSLVHIDAADSAIAWELKAADLPALQTWAQDAGHTTMVVVGNKVFVKGQGPTADPMFVVDLTTKKQVTSTKLDLNSGDNSFGELLTDGTGLYVMDLGTFYELDQDTLAPKRKLSLGGSSSAVFSVTAPIFAGAAWYGILCGGHTYIRRIDLAAFTIADLLYPSGQGMAPQAYAYLAP